MLALITGASSGIGRDMARVLSNRGYDLILVARDKNNLKKLQEELNTNVDIISMDLSDVENCKSLYEQVKDKNIDILIIMQDLVLLEHLEKLIWIKNYL